MRYLNKKIIWESLHRQFPKSDGNWFYDRISEVTGWQNVNVAQVVSLTDLIEMTLDVIHYSKVVYPLIVFPEKCLAGWKEGRIERRRTSPVEVDRDNDLIELLKFNIHFRSQEGYVDNYYVTNPNYDWFVVFCHHNDWHFWGSSSQVKMLRRKWGKTKGFTPTGKLKESDF